MAGRGFGLNFEEKGGSSHWIWLLNQPTQGITGKLLSDETPQPARGLTDYELISLCYGLNVSRFGCHGGVTVV
jgi:hypothetical protein